MEITSGLFFCNFKNSFTIGLSWVNFKNIYFQQLFEEMLNDEKIFLKSSFLDH